MASVGAPSDLGAEGAWGAEGALSAGAGVLGVEVPGAVGGGCAGFCVGRGNGCGVCAGDAVANKLNANTQILRTTELV